MTSSQMSQKRARPAPAAHTRGTRHHPRHDVASLASPLHRALMSYHEESWVEDFIWGRHRREGGKKTIE